MSDSAEPEKVLCPVCQQHTKEEALDSQGLILTALTSYYKADAGGIKDAFDVMTPFDGHVAVTMLANFIKDICQMNGIPLTIYMAMYRKSISDKQAQS